MSYKLFLDDERDPSDVYCEPGHPLYGEYESLEMEQLPDYLEDLDWVIARSYNHFAEILREEGIPAYVSYDYYLTGSPKGPHGNQCAKRLMRLCQQQGRDHPAHYAHTSSGEGALEIYRITTPRYR